MLESARRRLRAQTPFGRAVAEQYQHRIAAISDGLQYTQCRTHVVDLLVCSEEIRILVRVVLLDVLERVFEPIMRLHLRPLELFDSFDGCCELLFPLL